MSDRVMRVQDLAVHQVEALGVDLQAVQRALRQLLIDGPVGLDLGEVADPAEEPIGDPWGSP